MIRFNPVSQCRTLTHTYLFKTAESDLTLRIYDFSQKCVFKKTFSQVDIAPNTQFSLSDPSMLLETMRQKNLIPFESIHSIPTVEECSKDIAVYKQTLTEDPYHFKTYPLLAALLSNPREKAHIFLTGACYALRKEEYQLAHDFCSQAEELHEDSFIDRLVELDLLSKQGGLPKDKLLQIAALYEKKNLPELMIKAYRMLTQLDHDPPAYCYEKIIIAYDKIQKPKKALQWTHSYFNSLIKDKKWQQVVVSYSNLGSIYKTQKQYGKAIEYFKQSLKISEEVLGKNHPNVAFSFLHLGHIYHEQKQYDNAIKLYEQALTGIEKDNPYIATLLDALGQVYYIKEQYDKAIECYERALDNIKNKNGSAAAQLFSDLGSVYKAKKWYSKAIELHKCAVEVLETVLEKDHPRVAIFINKLGTVYHAQEEYDEAIKCYERALEIRKKALGEDHPHVAIFLTNLGRAYYAKEEYDKAIKFYEQALKTLEKLERNHPKVVALLKDIDNAYKAQGQRGKAIKLEVSENE